MVEQQGRDNEEVVTRRDGMTERDGSTAQRAPEAGMAGGRSGVDAESVDFDDMGDLDRGANDARDAEPSTGPGPGYGMAGTGSGARSVSRSGVGNTGSDVTTGAMGSAGEGAGTGNWSRDIASPNASVLADSSDVSDDLPQRGPGGGTTPALRISSDAGDPGSGIADDEGFGQGSDMDLTTTSGGTSPTGTPRRAGLGGMDSGDTMANDPAVGSGMANPADMGDQG